MKSFKLDVRLSKQIVTFKNTILHILILDLRAFSRGLKEPILRAQIEFLNIDGRSLAGFFAEARFYFKVTRRKQTIHSSNFGAYRIGSY